MFDANDSDDAKRKNLYGKMKIDIGKVEGMLPLIIYSRFQDRFIIVVPHRIRRLAEGRSWALGNGAGCRIKNVQNAKENYPAKENGYGPSGDSATIVICEGGNMRVPRNAVGAQYVAAELP